MKNPLAIRCGTCGSMPGAPCAVTYSPKLIGFHAIRVILAPGAIVRSVAPTSRAHSDRADGQEQGR